ncbi:fiber 2 protein [Psittacine adenovirus 3]|uniref:Fiber 2 protein n=1 Tax=Psittacine adenovirus 3 TaxID=1580497 RepID=A0A5C0PVQ3_9ADEN|nr:fiber 2 protein [Psittacine adenovirus 3]
MQPASKRPREESSAVDLVYPFDEAVTAPLPPFIDVGGGLETEGLKLSLNVSSPLTLRNNAVALKIGSGLSVDSSGALQAGAAASVSPPLTNSGGTLHLSVGSGLTVANGVLASSLTASPPLSISGNNTLALAVGNGLAVSGGALASSLSATPPLQLSGNSMSLSLGSGLAVQSGALVASPPVTAPVTITNGALGLSVGDGLAVRDGSLQAPTEIFSGVQGWDTLDNFSAVNIVSSEGVKFPASVFCKRLNIRGLVVCTMALKLDSSRWSSYGSTTPSSDFVFRLGELFNSGVPSTYVPVSAGSSYLTPHGGITTSTTSQSSGYVSPEGGIVVTFRPACSGAWANQFDVSQCTVVFPSEGGTVLHFSLQNKSGQTNYLFTHGITGTMLIYPISFSYLATSSL